MRYVLAEPSRHPTAWLSLVTGLVLLATVLLMRDLSGTGLPTFLMGLALTAFGGAELLPNVLKPITVALRLTGLLLASATIVVSLYALIFQVP